MPARGDNWLIYQVGEEKVGRCFPEFSWLPLGEPSLGDGASEAGVGDRREASMLHPDAHYLHRVSLHI